MFCSCESLSYVMSSLKKRICFYLRFCEITRRFDHLNIIYGYFNRNTGRRW